MQQRLETTEVLDLRGKFLILDFILAVFRAMEVKYHASEVTNETNKRIVQDFHFHPDDRGVNRLQSRCLCVALLRKERRVTWFFLAACLGWIIEPLTRRQESEE